jgi:hypothetical protein
LRFSFSMGIFSGGMRRGSVFLSQFFGRHATYADGGAMGPKVPFLVAIYALEAFSKVVEANLSRGRRCKRIPE